jgi:hypothetical protein
MKQSKTSALVSSNSNVVPEFLYGELFSSRQRSKYAEHRRSSSRWQLNDSGYSFPPTLTVMMVWSKFLPLVSHSARCSKFGLKTYRKVWPSVDFMKGILRRTSGSIHFVPQVADMLFTINGSYLHQEGDLGFSRGDSCSLAFELSCPRACASQLQNACTKHQIAYLKLTVCTDPIMFLFILTIFRRIRGSLRRCGKGRVSIVVS